MALDAAGVLEKYGVELIGASIEAIDRGENRQIFKKIVEDLGGEVARVRDLPLDGRLPGRRSRSSATRSSCGPSFTMGGTGSGMAYDEDDLRRIAGAGLDASPTTEVLLEESILGWKEYELEVMRDTADNVVIICSIENLDPMGVHTGDSITVAPAMTLTDREYQQMRDLAIGIIRSVGVDTGGCNIQYAVNPRDGRLIVIEMNPRVSRSSALASKATGFPIAKIAAKVAIGYTLDEIPNDITTEKTAEHAGVLRAVAGLRRGQGAAVRVREVPRRRPDPDHAHEVGRRGDGDRPELHRGAAEGAALAGEQVGAVRLAQGLRRRRSDEGAACSTRSARPHDGRLKKVMDALRAEATPEEIFEATGIDPWFVDQLAADQRDRPEPLIAADELTPELLRTAKRHGFSDLQIGKIRGYTSDVVRGVRHALGDPAGLQDRRHLRGRVRGADAVPLLLLRRGDRGDAPARSRR